MEVLKPGSLPPVNQPPAPPPLDGADCPNYEPLDAFGLRQRYVQSTQPMKPKPKPDEYTQINPLSKDDPQIYHGRVPPQQNPKQDDNPQNLQQFYQQNSPDSKDKNDDAPPQPPPPPIIKIEEVVGQSVPEYKEPTFGNTKADFHRERSRSQSFTPDQWEIIMEMMKDHLSQKKDDQKTKPQPLYDDVVSTPQTPAFEVNDDCTYIDIDEISDGIYEPIPEGSKKPFYFNLDDIKPPLPPKRSPSFSKIQIFHQELNQNLCHHQSPRNSFGVKEVPFLNQLVYYYKNML